MTKSELVKKLKEATIKNAELKKRVDETLTLFEKNMTKVSKSVLESLLSEIDSNIPAVTEKSLKKPVKRSQKHTETEEPAPVEEIAPVEELKPAEEAPKKKTAKAKTGKKGKPVVETVEPLTDVLLPYAKVFPDTVEIPNLGLLESCRDEFATYKEFADEVNRLVASDSDEELLIAGYWTKRHIKYFDYANSKLINPELVKKGFPHDLDIIKPILACETIDRIVAMSMYTEAVYYIDGDDVPPVEQIDLATDTEFKCRISRGMEFEIYRLKKA